VRARVGNIKQRRGDIAASLARIAPSLITLASRISRNIARASTRQHAPAPLFACAYQHRGTAWNLENGKSVAAKMWTYVRIETRRQAGGRRASLIKWQQQMDGQRKSISSGSSMAKSMSASAKTSKTSADGGAQHHGMASAKRALCAAHLLRLAPASFACCFRASRRSLLSRNMFYPRVRTARFSCWRRLALAARGLHALLCAPAASRIAHMMNGFGLVMTCRRLVLAHVQDAF